MAADKKAPANHNELASLLGATDRPKEAERAYRAALALNRRYERSVLGLARLLLSQDVCLRSNYATFGGPGYAYVVTTFADRLRAEGFEDSDLDQLFVDNPRRMLTGE